MTIAQLSSAKNEEMAALAEQLEGNRAQLDDMGAHIAAAHLNAAITRLRKMTGSETAN